MPNKIKVFGLKELPKDGRDFKLSAILKLPKLEDLPEEFELPVKYIKNQLDSDYCSAMATCGMSELQEGVELSPEWSFAVSKMISGDPESYGQDLRTSCKVHTKYGAIEKNWSPYSVKDTPDQTIRYIANWPKELFDKAKKHQKQSYFEVDGPYDRFDDIRATIWHFWLKSREANDDRLMRAVNLGVNWSWPLDQKVMTEVSEEGSGHAIYVSGWRKIDGKDYLIIRNSYGLEAGDNGKHYFSREIINKFAEKYGDFMFMDMPVSEAKVKSWSFWRLLWEGIKGLFKSK